jgi:hypothetical protein
LTSNKLKSGYFVFSRIYAKITKKLNLSSLSTNDK